MHCLLAPIPCSFPQSPAFWRSGASALPCAGAAPPQRPPPKPSLATATLCTRHRPPPTAFPLNRPRQTPCTRKSQPITRIPQITVQTSPPNPPSHQQPPHTRKSQTITKSPKSQFRQNPPFPPPTPARVQITVHHENLPNHSSDKIPNAPRQPPHTRKSQPITKISQITVQTKSLDFHWLGI